ncbi:ERCC4 domain-containing protein [Phytohabitans kaempferiae]|uniref:Histone-like nucleoid-structuring protein Lsr2 n=1 Tax=Phytohabitans kaempferiae TaxID=1620943 RepID=A0ABV6MCN1_9ACTN
MAQFVIARNPEPDSRLPYLLWVPLGQRGVLFKAGGTWPRTSAVYCHPIDGWPDDAEVLERLPVRSCVRRGAAIDLVLDRGRENRSQFVFTTARGREVVFWQSPRTVKQSRPGVRRPTARAAGIPQLEILVDIREQYPYRFADQRVSVTRRPLPAGDYAAMVDGRLVATVERKSIPDLISSITGSKLKYAMADLAALPHAAIVVEDRYAAIFKQTRVRPATVADALAELQITWPAIPIVFADTRALAEEWTYRFLAAAAHHAGDDAHGRDRLADLPEPAPPPAPDPTAAEIRAWARTAGLDISNGGRIPVEIREAYRHAHT